MKNNEELKAKFSQIYADLSNDLRRQIIVLVDEKTYTWNSTYFEVKNNTELSKKLLKSLNEIGII
jgi:hypothetical protein